MLVRFRCPSCSSVQLRGTSTDSPYQAGPPGTNMYLCGACRQLIDGAAVQAGQYDIPENEEVRSTVGRPLQFGYQPRVLALLDLLGFSSATDRSTRDPKAIVDIHRSLAAMREVFPHWSDHTREVEDAYRRMAIELQPALREHLFGEHELFRTAMFSDTVAFSGPLNPLGLEVVMATTAFLWLDMCSRGWLVRGGLAGGLLHHSETQMFGPALIEAHHLESNIAIFPRIALSDHLVGVLAKMEESGVSHPLRTFMVRRGPDRVSYLDTLGAHLAYATGYGTKRAEMMMALRLRIEENTSDKRLDRRIQDKWAWLGSYFNEVIASEPSLRIEPLKERPST